MSQDSEWSNGYKAGLADGHKEELSRISLVIINVIDFIAPSAKDILLKAIGYSKDN